MNVLLAVFSRDASGLLVAALIAALGVALRLVGAPLVVAASFWIVALVLAVMSSRHLVTLARARRAFPPPGRLVDIGGYRVHVLAEGEAREGRPPVVWFAGGHAAGNAIHHLHRAFRGETRSILIDRPGTGWSDVGPFPRSTAREADEMVLALERAGETGPFVWAGHSFGGLLAANIARRRPDLVHTLVLLDPTPLETIVFGPRLAALKSMRLGSWLGGFAQLFGIELSARREAEQRKTPAYAKVIDATRAVLGPAVEAARAIDARSGTFFAQASIYSELSPEGVAACAWDTVVYDRDLGDLPVWLVAPQSASDTELTAGDTESTASDTDFTASDAEATASDAEIALLPEAQNGGEANAQRMFRFFAASRERYLANSTRSRRIVAPAGAGHNFVYELPDFTIGVMRAAILGTPHAAVARAADAPAREAESHAA